jgi:hypothetical protein
VNTRPPTSTRSAPSPASIRSRSHREDMRELRSRRDPSREREFATGMRQA